jgi:hypothetical protein
LPEIFIHDDDILESCKNNSSILSNIGLDMLSQSTVSRHVSKNMEGIAENPMVENQEDVTVA